MSVYINNPRHDGFTVDIYHFGVFFSILAPFAGPAYSIIFPFIMTVPFLITLSFSMVMTVAFLKATFPDGLSDFTFMMILVPALSIGGIESSPPPRNKIFCPVTQ